MSEIDSKRGSNRREFIAGTTFGAAGFAQFCCMSPEAAAGSWSIEGGVLKIALTRERGLQKVGEPRVVMDNGRKLNIIVVQHDKGRWAALDRTCTHGGAMCAYQKRSRTIRCTSVNHAEFTLEGKLLHGRTHGDVRSYAVSKRQDWIEVVLETKA
ncbi:MAG TPA: Rieske 2Fe-2S domain-containing protein [Bryobacteraceae bacterium]|nr:Rieske 2Fe-2S domain-containing protein [Bryobacteraceae bacterium]